VWRCGVIVRFSGDCLLFKNWESRRKPSCTLF
jgi:hypothetical protein